MLALQPQCEQKLQEVPVLVMAAGLALHVAINNFALHACKALQSCRTSADLTHILRAIELVLQLATVRPDAAPAEQLELAEPLAESYARVQVELRQSQHWSATMAQLILRHIEPITFSLLPGELMLQLVDQFISVFGRMYKVNASGCWCSVVISGTGQSS